MANDNKKNLSDREVVLNYIGEDQPKAEKGQTKQKQLPKDAKKGKEARANYQFGNQSGKNKNLLVLGGKKRFVASQNQPKSGKSSASPPIDLPSSSFKKTKNSNLNNKIDKKQALLRAKLKAKINLSGQRQKKLSKKQKKFNLKFNFNFLKGSFKLAIKIILVCLALFLLLYLAFVFLVLGFGIDNNLSRKISFYLPVPGLVTPVGFIDYYTYKDLSTHLSVDKLIKEMIIRQALAKYGLQAGVLSQSGLNGIILNDKEINKKALTKIAEIRKLAGKSSLKLAAQKSGAEYGIITLDKQGVDKRFGSSLLNLPVGQISPLIIKDEGYYLVQIISKSKTLYTLSYAFVRGIDWEQYLAGQMKKVWLWQIK